jgi:hypothetical protein
VLRHTRIGTGALARSSRRSPFPRRPTSTGRFHRRSLTPRQMMVHETPRIAWIRSLERFLSHQTTPSPLESPSARPTKPFGSTRRGRFPSQKLRNHVGCLCAALQLQVPPFRQVNRSRTCASVTQTSHVVPVNALSVGAI